MRSMAATKSSSLAGVSSRANNPGMYPQDDDYEDIDEPPIDEEAFRLENMSDEEYDDWLEHHGQPPIHRPPRESEDEMPF